MEKTITEITAADSPLSQLMVELIYIYMEMYYSCNKKAENLAKKELTRVIKRGSRYGMIDKRKADELAAVDPNAYITFKDVCKRIREIMEFGDN